MTMTPPPHSLEYFTHICTRTRFGTPESHKTSPPMKWFYIYIANACFRWLGILHGIEKCVGGFFISHSIFGLLIGFLRQCYTKTLNNFVFSFLSFLQVCPQNHRLLFEVFDENRLVRTTSTWQYHVSQNCSRHLTLLVLFVLHLIDQ